MAFRAAVQDMHVNLRSTARVEWLWTLTRITVITVTIVTALVMWGQPSSGYFVFGAAGAAAVHAAIAGWMIHKGYVAKVLLISFTLDTMTMLVGWTGSLWMLGPDGPPTDLYLALFPILAVWTARLGFALGSVYLVSWLAWIAWTYTFFYEPTHYSNEQLPVRIVFLGLAGLISMGVTSIAKQQKRELERSRAEARNLRESSAAKDEFIAGLSHELRTPLAAMLGFTSVLSKNRSGKLDTEHISKLAVIERNGRRLESMIADLLDVSKIEAGQIELDKEAISISGFVADITESFEPLLASKDQTIDVPANLPDTHFIGDKARLGQVLTNLISNASKYSGTGHIELGARVVDNIVELSVTDHGNGISQEDQERIFTRFFRSDDAINSGVSGTGIGLYLCQNLVELHDGRIRVESQVGIGTTVYVEIPLVEPAADHDYRPEFGMKNRFHGMATEG